MKRKIRLSERGLLAGLHLILLSMIIHDWVPLGSLNDIGAVSEVYPFKELLTATLINAGQVIVLILLVRWRIGRRYPVWVRLWLVIHQCIIVAGVIKAWWMPYVFGIGAEEKAGQYEILFGNTHAFLSTMHGITPNTFHTVLHGLLLICLLLTLYICLTGPNKKKQKKKKSR